MRHIGAVSVFIMIAGLLVLAVFAVKKIDQPPVSQAAKMVATYNLTMLSASPYRISIPVNATSSNVTISALYSLNGSATGGLKVVTANLTFASGNQQIAVVNAAGQVTGVAPGTTNLTVAYTDGIVTKAINVPVTITAPPPGT